MGVANIMSVANCFVGVACLYLEYVAFLCIIVGRGASPVNLARNFTIMFQALIIYLLNTKLNTIMILYVNMNTFLAQ